ncbi:MAG: hypothetical protein NZ898_06130 [Myxococcota bacterium]|nr:hypothetical protein [Myxococcota bacterium]MDW8362190.1 hypothetical protein [Myxococcales bacterium]
MRSFGRFSPLFAFALAVPLAGCPIYSDDDRGGGTCVGPGCVCGIDFACPDRSYCGPDGECVPGCRSDGDCADGERCVAGECRVPEVACRTHGDCDPGRACIDGRCVSSETCSDDARCGAGRWCDFRDTCVPREEGQCRSTADCASTRVCVEGRCRDIAATCQFNYQCGAGRACVDGHCTAVCTRDEACGPGQACQGGFCRPARQCTTSRDCAAGHCVDGRCLADCRATDRCAAGAVCAEDEFCRPDWAPRPFCTTDAQCAEGHVCRDGACRTPCPSGTNDECRRYDVQLPICASDNLCYSTNETMPECRSSRDCTDEICIDGICR